MTTLWPRTLRTSTATTTTPTTGSSTSTAGRGRAPAATAGLSQALDELSHVAADLADDAPTRAALARAVVLLEQAAGADLGAADRDPLISLQRRLGRAALRLHDLAAADAPAASGLSAEQVRAHVAALRCPVPAQRRSGTAARPVGVLAGC